MKPLVEIHTDSQVPVYRQITDSLRRHLVDGRLKAGDLLPPVRQLALDLGVHFNTVAQAYRELADEGWLDLRRRRGAMVLHRHGRSAPDPQRIERILGQLDNLTAELLSEGLSRAQIVAAFRRLTRSVQA